MKKAKEAFQTWKDADEAARGGEIRLREAWDAYERLDNPGPVPSAALMFDIAKLRVRAQEDLVAVMLSMEDS